MTTTSTMCGLGSEEKPTSRVLRPPGGESSDIFGTTGSQDAAPRRQNNRGSSDIFGTSDSSSPQSNTPNRNATSHDKIFGAEDHKIYGKGRNQSKFNPITGEPYNEDGSPAAANDTPNAEPAPQPQAAASPAAVDSAQTGQGDSASLQAAPGKAQPEVRTSSRVLNPPGGHTHQLW